jgi:hypothetical protein
MSTEQLIARARQYAGVIDGGHVRDLLEELVEAVLDAEERVDRAEYVVARRDAAIRDAHMYERLELDVALTEARRRTEVTDGTVDYVVHARDVGPWRVVER